MDLPLRSRYMTTTGLAYIRNSPVLPYVPRNAGMVAGPGVGEKFSKSTDWKDPEPFTVGTQSGSTIPGKAHGSQRIKDRNTRRIVLGLQILTPKKEHHLWYKCWGEVFLVFTKGKRNGEQIKAEDCLALFYSANPSHFQFGANQVALPQCM